MILRMNHQALYAPIPIFQRSSNVPRGTFSKDQHLFQYSDVSRGTFLRKNALRHHPFDFSILVRSKNSLHILDSNRQELFFFARLVVRNLMPGSQAPNTMRRLKDQLLFQCSNLPRGTFSKEGYLTPKNHFLCSSASSFDPRTSLRTQIRINRNSFSLLNLCIGASPSPTLKYNP